MIKIENLSKKYGENKVFENDNFFIEENRMTAIMGKSGRGKTTLLRIILGLEKYEGNMDAFFSEKENSEYSFQKVIEPGRIYEMGYPKCLCFMHDMGFTKSEVHCECSRQSILFVLHELFPGHDFEVKTIGTVLGGCDKCTFRITVINKK